MKNLIPYILFKVVSFIFEMILALELLVNEFIRHVYIPFFMSANNPQKIIGDINTFAKKPQDEITMAVNVKVNRGSDLKRTALKIVRYAKIIEESIAPNNFNCFLTSQDLNKDEMQSFRTSVNQLQPKQSKLKIILENEVDYMEKLKLQKSKITPLIISFSGYPSINGLPPQYLIGAEIRFNPPILKTVDYDIFIAFQKYSTSEQRKGK